MLVYDPSGKPHDKEPVDVRECVEALGWTREPPAPAAPEQPPTPLLDAAAAAIVAARAPDTVAELRAWLKAHDVAVPHNASKVELLALYEAANARPA